ncbi:MAG: tripartite tricarboxylate transporter TctB family protein [Deltaproteobacteria bacterium]|nr:tripartite tricarboxylate transporter TctB family protein [Deltaproteobacteria bacterium]
MKKADRISGLFWFLFAVIIVIKSYRLGLGKVVEPGPGFLFFWAGIVLGIMSLAIIFGSFKRKKTEEPDKPIFGSISFRKILFVLVAVFLYALLIETLGFILVTVMLFIFLLCVVEKKGWLLTILSSFSVTIAAYLVFQTWLGTQLPRGILGFLRF